MITVQINQNLLPVYFDRELSFKINWEFEKKQPVPKKLTLEEDLMNPNKKESIEKLEFETLAPSFRLHKFNELEVK